MLKYIIVNCSSIYNIDFANLLFCKIYYQKKKIKIFFNEKVAISKNENSRKYISRLSLPLFEWKKDSEKNWKLLHYPIDKINDKENFTEIVQNYCLKINKLIKQGSGSENLNSAEFNSLSAEFKEGDNQILNLYSDLIRIIIAKISKISKSEIEIVFSGNYYLGDKLQNAHLNVLSKIVFFLNNTDSKSIQFIKGGKILIYSNGDWLELDGAIIKEDKLVLTNSTSPDQFVLDLKFNKFQNKNIRIKFIGSLEFLFYSQFGIMVDLPNYFNADFSAETPCNIEFVSPISVSDISRVSNVQGGMGFRLNPSGYSLLDYRANDNVLFLIRGVLNENRLKWDDLEEFNFLINNYPRTSEKISEDQNSIKKYISDLEKKMRINFREIDSVFNFFINEFENLLPTNLGLNMLSISSFLNHLKEIASPHTNFGLNEVIKKQLICKGIVLGNNLLTEVLLKQLDEYFIYAIDFFKLIGLPDFEIKSYKIKYINAKNFVLEKELNIYDKSKKTELIFQSLNSLKDLFNELIYEYYTFMIFFITSALKANIYTSYFCLGERGYYDSIRKIINERNGREYLAFTPLFFKEI